MRCRLLLPMFVVSVCLSVSLSVCLHMQILEQFGSAGVLPKYVKYNTFVTFLTVLTLSLNPAHRLNRGTGALNPAHRSNRGTGAYAKWLKRRVSAQCHRPTLGPILKFFSRWTIFRGPLLPSPPLRSRSLRSRAPWIQLGGRGSTVSSPVGSGAKLQRTTILVLSEHLERLFLSLYFRLAVAY